MTNVPKNYKNGRQMREYHLKPINDVCGIFLLAAFAISIIHFHSLPDMEYTLGFKLFAVISILFHFVIGLGLLLRKNWGYHPFKLYLLCLYLGFPLGTYRRDTNI